MIKRFSLGLVAMTCVALVAMPALGASVFFSEVGTVGGGVAVGNPVVNALAGGSATLYIWSTDDQNYDTSIGINVVNENPGEIAFTGAQVENPELLSMALGGVGSGTMRWQDVNVNGGNPVEADLVSTMNAVHVTEGTGITTANDGTVGLFKLQDPLWDMDAGAFLLGSVDLTYNGPGDAVVTMNQDGTALFVNEGGRVDPEFGTATITAGIPEPSTVLLAVLGLIGLAGFTRTKR